MIECWYVLTIDQLKADSKSAIAIGPFGSRMKSDTYVKAGVPVIRGNNLSATRAFTREFVYITPEFADRLGSSNLREGDLVFPHRGNIGAVGIVGSDEPRYIMSTSMMKLTCNTDIVDPLYLFYFFRSDVGRHELLKNASQVGTPGIATHLSSLRSIRVLLPPLCEQHEIAQILGSLDDKIDLNRRMNETLEAIARAWFIEWSVRTRARSETVRVAELIERKAIIIGDGYRAKRSELSDQGLPFARAGNLKNGFDFTGAELLGPDGISAAGPKIAKPLDIAFTSKGTVGRMAQVTEGTPPFVYSPQLCYWRVTDPSVINPHVLHHWMRGTEFLGQLDSVKGQTDMADFVSLTDQRRMLVSLAPIDDQEQISSRLEPISRLIDKNISQTSTLTALRDALLPKLLSGKIRVGAAERTVEEAV